MLILAKPQTRPHLSNHGHHHWLCHGVSQPEAQIHIPLGHRAKLVKVKAHLYESSRYFSYAHAIFFTFLAGNSNYISYPHITIYPTQHSNIPPSCELVKPEVSYPDKSRPCSRASSAKVVRRKRLLRKGPPCPALAFVRHRTWGKLHNLFLHRPVSISMAKVVLEGSIPRLWRSFKATSKFLRFVLESFDSIWHFALSQMAVGCSSTSSKETFWPLGSGHRNSSTKWDRLSPTM